MKKYLLLFIVVLGNVFLVKSQDSFHTRLEQLRSLTTSAKTDSIRMSGFLDLGKFYIDINNDSSIGYARQAYQISLLLKDSFAEAQCLDFMGAVSLRMGNSDQAIDYLLKAKQLFEALGKSTFLIVVNRNIGGVYKGQHDFTTAREYYLNALGIRPRSAQDSVFYSWALMDMGELLYILKKYDSALAYSQQSYEIIQRVNTLNANKYLPFALNTIGNIYQQSGKFDKALETYRQAVTVAFTNFNMQAASNNYLAQANVFHLMNRVDSGLFFARKAFYIARQVNSPQAIEEASRYLKDYFRTRKSMDSAFVYQEIMAQARDSLQNLEKIRQVQNISFNEQKKQEAIRAQLLKKQEEIQKQLLSYRNNVKMYVLLSGLAILLFVSLVLFRNNRQKQKAKISIETAYKDLKATQAQLIQSEKMASLGELTAGIAHEIQNPLNFVNNFSEVNKELVAELKQAIKTDDKTEIEKIAIDIEANEEKINHHGKRAEAIVKGMLQHAQSSTGKKQPIEINALTEEYLRLAYHGVRAKDKTFNATLITDYDKTIQSIQIVPQDIGRVLLNMFNNAFYAVDQKNKEKIEGFVPMIWVSTNKLGNKIEICIKDNGTGIPQKHLDKIFQPFYTTKPAGQGTGLGLSLSYDFVKAHGGELKVESKEGVGTEFVVQLPVV